MSPTTAKHQVLGTKVARAQRRNARFPRISGLLPTNILPSLSTWPGFVGRCSAEITSACLFHWYSSHFSCSPYLWYRGIIHPHTRSSFRNFELSLQSPLHPSITLLVRYRSHTGIQPYQGHTWQFKLHSQRALLVHVPKSQGPTKLPYGAVTLYGRPFQVRLLLGSDTLPFDSAHLASQWVRVAHHTT